MTRDSSSHVCICDDCAVAPFDDRCKFERAMKTPHPPCPHENIRSIRRICVEGKKAGVSWLIGVCVSCGIDVPWPMPQFTTYPPS